MQHNVPTTPPQRLSDICVVTEQTANRKADKPVSSLLSATATSSATKMYACPSLSLFFSLCTSQCPHSLYTQPSCYLLVHRKTAKTRSNKSVLAHLSTFSSQKQKRQKIYLLGPMKYVKGEVYAFSFLQKLFCHPCTHELDRIYTDQSSYVFARLLMARNKTLRLLALPARTSHHFSQYCRRSCQKLLCYLPAQSEDKIDRARRVSALASKHSPLSPKTKRYAN